MTTKLNGQVPVLISACLLGLKSRYNCKAALSPEAKAATEGRYLIPICPEQMAGLPTPRPSAEICGGNGNDVLDGKATVVDENGKDVTSYYLNGAKKILEIAKLNGSKEIILKEKSPACGVTTICSENETIEGMGVTTALLLREGYTVRGL
ncbi:MAG: DUF523 domain-containing protein [Proteobacteria bacterium]|nr:DUF523 domain-containing protein [Pseudomonadota bacterium]